MNCNALYDAELLMLTRWIVFLTAPPHFTVTPKEVEYVSLGDPIILNCLAVGTPVPEILWLRDSQLVQTSASLAVTNDGTELRISNIRQEDIGDYTCSADNGQGTVRHTTKLIIAGNSFFLIFSSLICTKSHLQTQHFHHFLPKNY